MPGRTRRAFALSATTFLGGFAGCSALSPDSDRPTRTAYLAALTLRNHDPEARTLHVLVEQDGEPVYWRSHRLGPRGGEGAIVEVDPSWDVDASGEYVVRGRVDDSADWRTFDLTELPPVEGEEPPHCEGIELEVREGGVDMLYNLGGPEECPVEE